MKRLIAVVLAIVTVCASAQTGKSEALYPALPEFAWEMIIDHVAPFDCRMIGSHRSQYLGQVDGDYKLCGFGFYIDSKDNQRVGLFRNGSFAYGITLTQSSALVGTPTDYACYSMTTAQLEFVTRRGEKQPAPVAVGAKPKRNGNEPTREVDQPQSMSQFVSITYENGDRYIGEAVDGKRHGLGIYYYKNGDFWFGQYRNGLRDGYGCLYCSNHDLWIGHWQGEDVRRMELVRMKE